MNTTQRNPLQLLTRSSLCAALLAVCAWLTVPAAVPFTMQSFGIFLSLLLFGGKLTAIAVTVYVLLGAAGLPVFAGMQGGIGVMLGTHGGFFMGFLFMALTDWLLERWFPHRSMVQRISSIAAELLICYLAGTAWYMLLTDIRDLRAALSICVLPFLLPDSVKLMLAAALCKPLKRRMRR